jgi:hypothetical protein
VKLALLSRAFLPALLALLVAATGAGAASLAAARSGAIAWLERNQNPNGSWGAKNVRWVTTSEALLALARADRAGSVAAQRAVSWLRQHQTPSLDGQARSLRALAAAGVNVQSAGLALNALGDGPGGWGLVAGSPRTSYDTAVVIAGVRASGVTAGLAGKKNWVRSKVRWDFGWSGDGIPNPLPPLAAEPSDLVATAEILRALAGTALATETEIGQALVLVSNAGAPIETATPLELASRLAALHAYGETDPPLEGELLGRFGQNGSWSDDDPLVNAIGLLAVATKPEATFTPDCPNAADADCDGVADGQDAFPHDPGEQTDLDRDGIGGHADLDDDGDGLLDGVDPFPGNPLEWADLDGDGVGDNGDTDDDGDGLADLAEYEAGTSPFLGDSDGDRFADGPDGSIDVDDLAGGWDLDDDGFVDGEQEFGSDPTDVRDHPGKPGDVAPLGRPDAGIGVEDLAVLVRVLADPSVVTDIPRPQNRDIAAGALDANEDGRVDAGDAIEIHEQAP